METNRFFPEINGKFGFGMMRLPQPEPFVVDMEQTCRMVDKFLEAGFNYFDTAHGYIKGASEKAVKACLTSRYPRERYLLADKLSEFLLKDKTEDEILPFFNEQLECCGVEYFDFYLLHSITKDNYPAFEAMHAFEVCSELKKQGKIRHLGFSFHAGPELLDQILTRHPEVEFVQIQFNYLDALDDIVQSMANYEVLKKHDKPVFIMEPVKGGFLADLPEDAKAVYTAVNHGSPASYALRYAADFGNTAMVLSGMSLDAQMEDNLKTMKDAIPLTVREMAAINKVLKILKSRATIPCTKCGYCMNVCPQGINIPGIFALANSDLIYPQLADHSFHYKKTVTTEGHRASDCLRCGACEGVCPQQIQIRSLLEEAAQKFEK